MNAVYHLVGGWVMNTPRSVLAGLIFLASAGVANAAVVNKLVTFDASFFYDSTFSTGTAPVDPVMGSFVISLDDATTYNDMSTGISFMSPINIAFSSTLQFNYDPGIDRLEVGGSAGPVGCGSTPGDCTRQINYPGNDFWLHIAGFLSGSPILEQLGYSQSAFNYWYTVVDCTGCTDSTVSLSVTDYSPVPLPAGLPLLISAIGGLALLRRWRAGAHEA